MSTNAYFRCLYCEKNIFIADRDLHMVQNHEGYYSDLFVIDNVEMAIRLLLNASYSGPEKASDLVGQGLDRLNKLLPKPIDWKKEIKRRGK